MIKYIGKSAFIDDEKKILAIGDLHLGRGENRSEAGRILSREIYEKIVHDFKEIFKKINMKLNYIVLLGDLKDSFSNKIREERYLVINLIDFILKQTEKILVIRGNRDTFIRGLFGKNKKIEISECFVLGEFAFLHGDRDFSKIYDRKIKYWLMGHLHPNIKIGDGVKSEIYKCFLIGEYVKKKIIVLPSFLDFGQGKDILREESNLAWKFNLGNFEVKVPKDDLEILDFGKLKKITF